MQPKHFLGGATALLVLGLGSWLALNNRPQPTGPLASAAHAAMPAARAALAPAASAPIAAEPAPAPPRQLSVAALSAGSPLRRELDRLAPQARARAEAAINHAGCGLADENSLHADAAGRLYYACQLQVPPAPRATTAPATAAAAANTAAGSVPASQPPVRHSRPGAAATIYLDFNGHQITGTAWNLATDSRPAVATYDCRAYDIDGDPTTFNDQEQADINEVWERVAEDYAPFAVDVTTEEPATLGPHTARAVITSATDRNGTTMPSTKAANVAGVAYVDVFGLSNYAPYYSPALVYFDRLYSWPAYIAEAASHEVGHNLSLHHDGCGRDEYYTGHGSDETSWAPLMGAAYTRNVTQWSKGEYSGATNTEDDLQLIAHRLGYVADDTGGTSAAAIPMLVTGSELAAGGCLERTDDVDVFSFTSPGGACSLSVVPYRAGQGTHGGNSDLAITLLDASGATIAYSAPTATTTADLSASALAAGVYFVRISATGVGSPQAAAPIGYTPYGSLGRYIVTGRLALMSQPVVEFPTSGNGVFGWPLEFWIGANNPVVTYGASGLPDGVSVDPFTGRISGTPLQSGTFNATLTATNPAGTGTRSFTLRIDTAPPAITTAPARRTVLAPGQSTTLGVSAASISGNPTYRWYCNGQLLDQSTEPTLTIGPATREMAGWYQVSISDSYGTRTSPPAFVLVAPQATSTLVYHSAVSNVSNPPFPLSNPIAFSLSNRHALALQHDGSVRAWGLDAFGETYPPSGLAEVVAVAAGSGRSLALQADGTLVPWGGNIMFRTIPAAAQPAVAIAIASNGALAVRADGTIVAWGGGSPSLPGDLAGVASLATSATSAHAFAIRGDGTFAHWNFGDGPYTTPSAVTRIVAAATANEVSLAITPEHALVAWSATPGDPRTEIPTDLGPVTAVSVSSTHTVVVDTHGRARGWGSTYANGFPDAPGVESIWSAAAGFGCTLLIADDTPQPLAVVTPPSDCIVGWGGTAVFTATFSGRPEPALRWQVFEPDTGAFRNLADDPTISGSASGTLRLLNVTTAQDSLQFRCLADNGNGTPIATGVVRLTIAPTFAGFRALHFPGALDDPAVSGPAADPDHDGLGNLLEYAFGRDPLSGDTQPLLALAPDGAALRLSYVPAPAATDLVFTLQTSADLQDWTEVATGNESGFVPASNPPVSITVPTGGSQRAFYRVAVSPR